MYLDCLCTCSAVLGATDAMDESDMRAIENVSLSTCVSPLIAPIVAAAQALTSQTSNELHGPSFPSRSEGSRSEPVRAGRPGLAFLH
jgi:hypothetical protein